MSEAAQFYEPSENRSIPHSKQNRRALKNSALAKKSKKVRLYKFIFLANICFFRPTGNPFESVDGSNQPNTNEVIRYIRRRKFGRKRRSIYVKCRTSIIKNESIVTNNNDEQSQEYISRRRDSAVNESAEEEKPSPSKSPSKQPTFKQLTIDQFLKKIPSNPSDGEKFFEISPENNTTEEVTPEVQNEEFRLPRRTKRLSNTPHVSKSETDLVKMANGTSLETLKKPIRKFLLMTKLCVAGQIIIFVYNGGTRHFEPKDSAWSIKVFFIRT